MTSRSAFWAGARGVLPFFIVVSPFAMLFGVVGTEAGLNLAEVMGFTFLVIAGAAQFAALQMMADNASTYLVILAALAVNLRMAMYSAALVPHLGAAPLWQRALISYLNFDQTYAMSVAQFERRPDMSLPAKVAYFFGAAVPLATVWCGMTFVGAWIGAAIPADIGLDFALPLTFLAIIAPMLRTVAHVAAAAASIIGAIALTGLPTGVGLLCAAFIAMSVGVLVETLMERRKS